MHSIAQRSSTYWTSLCFLVITSGVISTEVPPTLFSPSHAPTFNGTTLYNHTIPIKITNRIYNDSLNDETSEYYRTLRGEVEQLLYDVYNDSAADYRELSEIVFSNGSVIADSTVVFGTDMTSQEVRDLFVANFQKNPSSTLELDLGFTGNTTGSLTTAKPVSSVPVINSTASGHTTIITSSPLTVTTTRTVSPSTSRPLTTPSPSQSGSDTSGVRGDQVPGWGIALLVLAALILLLLIILAIMLLVLCCCRRPRAPYPGQAFYNPDIPMYSTHSTLDVSNGKALDDMETPAKQRTGMYVVNK